MKSLSAPHSAMPSDEKAFRGVVLVIDPQMGWLNRYTEPTIKRLHSFLLEDGILDKTIITVFYNNENSNFRRLLSWWKGFTSDEDTEIIPGFKALNAPVFKRNTYGMPERFWRKLELMNINNILITGVETDASIIKTAMDAFDRGISAWIVESLVASTYGKKGQEAGIAVAKKVLGRDHVFKTPDMLSKEWFI